MTKRAAPEDFEEEPELFRDPPHNGRPTSISAALSKRSDASTERARVFDLVLKHTNRGGVTREDIEGLLEMPGNTVRPRVWELMGNGGHPARIRESGFQRKARSGRAAEILIALPSASSEPRDRSPGAST